ncbi:galactokinase [Sediminitomix flava]|uniref:Galactokinase n=1 Tax=Sediminitomix flava TaxID=379075 RepID=A0A315ZEV5_SEDFL|nr:galactokinase [Sediminitomix flava]PWJ43689.1 galactokinase [Sediminitomix flava]
MQIDNIVKKFEELYGTPSLISRAPGRVNIIGEHTDYNEGFVLPAAIDKEMVFALAKNGTAQVRAYALDLNEASDFLISELSPKEGWINYIIGVVAESQKKGLAVEGFDVVFAGDVPLGAGMSSSAALECGLGIGLNTLFEGSLTQKEIALVGQASEHNFAGVKCGIMDQFASTFGKINQVIQLDCRSQEFEYFPLNIQGHKLVLCNTNVTHSLASSEYNTRRAQCEAGVAVVKKVYSDVNSLRDISLEMLNEFKDELDAEVYDRCSYVIEENIRLKAACDCMLKNDLDGLGVQMYGSHDGLSKKYGVSCDELDFLVEQTRDKDYVLGARMMGGGFGGCTINLVKEEAVDQFIDEMTEAYQSKLSKKMDAYVVVIGEGARSESVEILS